MMTNAKHRSHDFDVCQTGVCARVPRFTFVVSLVAACLALSACGGGSTSTEQVLPATPAAEPDDIDERGSDIPDDPNTDLPRDIEPANSNESDPENGIEDGDESEDTPEDVVPGNDETPDVNENPVDVSNTVFTPSDSDIRDNVAIYREDGYSHVDVLRIDLKTNTVAGRCEEDDLSGCTLRDVLDDTDSRDEFKVDIPVHFSAFDFADDGTMNNAELRQRGGGARYAPQKSFRLKLDDKDQLWRGERHLQLNKHPFDKSRIRNKLSFDLMSDIPHLPSFRTQFVNLWIDDGAGPVNHGLYTHVERGDERYLKRRELGKKGRLYKAEFFRFRQSDRKTLLIDEDGNPLDKDVFESVLEIENGKDHRNLIAMLEALHDPQQSFQSVLDRYFNQNNVLTWIAVNLLIGQQDATRHNYFLYNPNGSETFYFLPWDYDFTFLEHDPPANEFTPEALRDRLGFGYARGSDNEFVESYYRMPGAHERIIAAAAELRENYLSDTRIAERAALLSSMTFAFASAQPDIEHNRFYSEKSSADFASKVSFNHDAMMNHFSIPLPPTLMEPERQGDTWRFNWTQAHELTGHKLTYELQVANSPAFLPDDIEFAITGIDHSDAMIRHSLDASQLSLRSTHYARVIARSVNEPERYWQISDNELVVDGVRYYGVVAFGQNL